MLRENDFLGLRGDGIDNLGVGVPGGEDSDATGKVEIAVVVYVPDLATLATIGDDFLFCFCRLFIGGEGW